MSRMIDADALLANRQIRRGADVIGIRDYVTVAEIENAPTIEPERENGIPRDAIEYILRKETVSTNPDDFTANEKFIKFMDDPEIASFGRWQHANGFNTALVAVKCDLEKIPDSEPERKTGEWIKDAHGIPICSECGFSAPFMEKVSFVKRRIEIIPSRYCWQCGAKMEDGE